MEPENQIDPGRIMHIGLGFWPSKTLLSAIEIGLFTELAKGPQEYSALCGKMRLHARSARDFLDTLVALQFLRREGDTYSNAPDTDLFLDRNKPSYIGGMLEMANERLYRFWGNLTEALRTGVQQNESKEGGESLFAALYSDPARLKSFLTAMSGLSRGANCAIAKKVPWSKYKSYADVGTAQGDLAVQVALANPHLEGIGFDLPEVQQVFEEYAQANGLDGRLRFQPGDFFTQELPNVDVITMGHILHDWNEEEKKMLVAKAFRALNPGGALVVYDAVIDDERSKNAFGLMMSLNMLIETPGGFDYTGAQCAAWMKEAGFRDVHVEPLVGPDSMVVAYK